MLISKLEFYDSLCKIFDELPLVMTNKKEQFYNIPAGFDIETSSFYINDTKFAIMYEWTFGIGYIEDNEFKTLVTYGRTWDEFATFLRAIACLLQCDPAKRRLVVYVHNLPYEWQFIRKRFSWTKVFLLDDRKPVYAITDDGIEFRCSLKLSGKSLANTAKDLVKYPVEKMVGDLNYSLIRHPNTPLTEKEWKYCENDVLVMLSYIQEKIESDKDITRIPLTKTGYVRRYVKKKMFQEVETYEDIYAELESETVGVSRTERMLSRRIYPRKCSPDWYDSQQSWFLRLHEFLSGGNGGI